MKKIAAITMARNDEFFLSRWIAYYGRELGAENLFVLLDGMDQTELPGANMIKMEHNDLGRAAFDKHKSRSVSALAHKLFDRGYDLVIGCDSDELLVADPATGMGFREYLSNLNIKTSVSGLGMDVGMDLNSEFELDKSKPFLEQRSFAFLSTRYTKPVVIARPVSWGRGFHRVNNHNFHIDPNLYLFHFGSVDYNMIKNKVGDRDQNWKKHLARRAETIHIITRKKCRPESNIKIARVLQTIFRPIYAWNKPAMFGLKLVTKIPERFKKIGI